MKRKIITIDEGLCNGCGNCIPNCPEGAIQIIDGKARLVSDLMCDGLGACLGNCPVDAISIEEREAEAYDERKVMVNIVKAGPNTLKAHLHHLKSHNQTEYYNEAIEYLKDNNLDIPEDSDETHFNHAGCPGSRSMSFANNKKDSIRESTVQPSCLSHWPIQMHLISPQAPHYRNSDLVLAADCTAFALGSFHQDFLQQHTLAIACPKLDDHKDVYIEKIRQLVDAGKINTLTVIMMEVPCCGNLLHIAKTGVSQASRKIPIKKVIIGLDGEVVEDSWV